MPRNTVELAKANHYKKILLRLKELSWYFLENKNVTYIVTVINKEANCGSRAQDVITAINCYLKLHQSTAIKVSSQSRNQLVYFDKLSFASYFRLRGEEIPKVMPAKDDLKEKFKNKTINYVSSCDNAKLEKLDGLTWYHLAFLEKNYVITEFKDRPSSTANNFATAINRYAFANNLSIKASYQIKYNLLYLTENDFVSYFFSKNKNVPMTMLATSEMIEKFKKSNIISRAYSKVKNNNASLLLSEPLPQFPVWLNQFDLLRTRTANNQEMLSQTNTTSSNDKMAISFLTKDNIRLRQKS